MSKVTQTVQTEIPPDNNPTNESLIEIHPVNFLSFGPETEPIRLKQLNVLIGPNGSGKSNLLEAISFMRSTRVDLDRVLLRGGGAREWLWKGRVGTSASVETVLASLVSAKPLRHRIEWYWGANAFRMSDESIQGYLPANNGWTRFPYYEFRDGHSLIRSKIFNQERTFDPNMLEPDTSILAQVRDPGVYPEITDVIRSYSQIRIYREWSFGRSNVFREPQRVDLPNNRLEEDFSNLGLFLNHITLDISAKRAILAGLTEFYQDFDDFHVQIEGGTVQVFFQENGFTVPATRLSDGTLRYLCLLAILYDPKPPRLICIEEPELGLHPDAIPTLAKLLILASQKTQLVVTTHSDILIDALSDHPEYVLVCEKHDGQTQMKRLEKDELKDWLEKYSLGQLWTRGQIGGTRW